MINLYKQVNYIRFWLHVVLIEVIPAFHTPFKMILLYLSLVVVKVSSADVVEARAHFLIVQSY